MNRLVVNLVAFCVVSVLLVGYGAVRLLGNPFADRLMVSAVFPHAAGVRSNFSVSMDGVVIGVVEAVELEGEGVRVSLAVNEGVTVPGDVEASIVRASPVGEQRVELTPTSDGTGAPLADGDEIAVADEPTPPDVSRMLDALARLVERIPPEDVGTAVGELAAALEGRGEDLRALTVASDEFARAFLANEADFRRLLATAPPVLDSVAAVGPELQSALESTAVLSDALAARRHDVVEMMRNVGAFATVAGDVVGSQKANIACLVSDFADLNRHLGQPDRLDLLARSLELNREFFGPVDKIVPYGPAADVGMGAPARDDQYWLRVRLLLPPAAPPAEEYPTRRPTPATRPGGACETAFGPGVPAASQSDPAPPADGGTVEPSPSRPATPGPDASRGAVAAPAVALALLLAVRHAGLALVRRTGGPPR